MKRRRKRIEDIALQRIERLFELAEVEARKTDAKERSRSDRYVQLAREIGMRYRVRIPSHLKMRFCNGCYAFLIPGENARVRLRSDYITTTCLRCGKQMRRPYKAPRAPSPRKIQISSTESQTNPKLSPFRVCGDVGRAHEISKFKTQRSFLK